MDTLLFVLVVVAHDVSSSQRIGEKDSKTWRISQPVEDFFRPLESSGSLGDLLEFDKGKFVKHLNFLNDAIVGHQLGHRSLVKVLRNTA